MKNSNKFNSYNINNINYKKKGFMKSVFFLIFLLLGFQSQANSQINSQINSQLQTNNNACPSNRILLKMGFVQHPSADFENISNQLYPKVIYDSDNFVLDLRNQEFVPTIGRNVQLSSWDDLRTPDLEMLGDVVFITDPTTNEALELRWYENGVKNFVVNESVKHPVPNTPVCAMEYFPFVSNALF